MKVIFLDVDGVLNTYELVRIHGLDYIHQEFVQNLQAIITATGAEIVLSSTWRVKERDRKLVENALANCNLRFIDCTTVWPMHTRAEQIQEWLSRNSVENYAIIDDDPDAGIEGHFFTTDPDEGLTPSVAALIIEHLN